MNISPDNPPYNVREKCERLFDLKDIVPVWTFKDTIYNPHNGTIDPFLEVHEACHARQQGDAPEDWWDDFFVHPKFRFRMELEAYQVQYQVMKDTVKDRNLLSQMLWTIAKDLSGPEYGNLCAHSEAMKLIRDGLTPEK